MIKIEFGLKLKKSNRPPQVENLLRKIHECISEGNYTETIHSVTRGKQRLINLPQTLYVLRNGWHEKQKTTFDESFNTWKYAIRGKTVDGIDVRVVLAFDENNMVIITVIDVGTI